MRCLFTQWSTPAENLFGDTYSGYPNKETFLWAWILSTTLAKNNIGSIELYCDTPAQDLLINQLDLQFDKVHITLDGKDNLRNVWAYGKMNTYMRQKEPFIHVDSDLFIYENMKDQFNHDYLFWGEEVGIQANEYYTRGYDSVISDKYVPDLLLKNPVHTVNMAPNFGLFYVKDVNCPAFVEYITELKKYFTINEPFFKVENHNGYYDSCTSIILEQYFFQLLLNKYNKPYKTFKHDIPKYLHFLAGSKRYYSENIKKRAIMLTGKKYIEVVNLICKNNK